MKKQSLQKQINHLVVDLPTSIEHNSTRNIVLMDCQAHNPWWRHQMETFTALLALCAGNSPVTGEFPLQRPVTRSIDVSVDLRLNKQLNKQSGDWRRHLAHYDVTNSRVTWVCQGISESEILQRNGSHPTFLHTLSVWLWAIRHNIMTYCYGHHDNCLFVISLNMSVCSLSSWVDMVIDSESYPFINTLVPLHKNTQKDDK